MSEEGVECAWCGTRWDDVTREEARADGWGLGVTWLGAGRWGDLCPDCALEREVMHTLGKNV